MPPPPPAAPGLEALLDALRAGAAGRVVVVGGGRTGGAAARLLARLGGAPTVVDDAPAEKLREGLIKAGVDAAALVDGAPEPASASGVSGIVGVVGGGIPAAVVAGADLLVLSPGVPRAHPAVAPALASVPCVNEVELAAGVLAAHGVAPALIGVTGTNGKSTTTTMCGAIARAWDPNAFVGGNLGTPYCACALDVLDHKPAPRVAVLELSSYQLETIQMLALDAAVVTNLSPDHLDRYPDAAAYYAAKARIFALVKPGGGAALNAADPESRAHLAAAAQGVGARCDFDISIGIEDVASTSLRAGSSAEPPGAIEIVAGPPARLRVLPPLAHAPTMVPAPAEGAGAVPVIEVTLKNPHIVGHHNRQNAAAAVAGALLAGIPPAAWQAGLDAYAGIAHRLERVGEHAGVAWFNDSKGTNVDATVTAVKSFAGGVHLIAGGRGKGTPYAPLVDVSKGRVAAVYTIGEDAQKIGDAYAAAGFSVVPCGTLDVACDKAAAAAKPGEVILLSPACASFDQFRDYAQRGEAFRAEFERRHGRATAGAPPGGKPQ